MASLGQGTLAAGAGSQSDAGTDARKELQELEQTVAQLQGLQRHVQTDLCSKLMIEIMTSIVDDLCFDVCADIHRSHLMRMLPLDDLPGQPANRVVDAPGYDIHGLIPDKIPKNEYFSCHHCHQKVDASRYTGEGGWSRTSDWLTSAEWAYTGTRTYTRARGHTSGGGAAQISLSPANANASRNATSPTLHGRGAGSNSPVLSSNTSAAHAAAVSPVQHKQRPLSASPIQHPPSYHGQTGPGTSNGGGAVPPGTSATSDPAALGKRQRELAS